MKNQPKLFFATCSVAILLCAAPAAAQQTKRPTIDIQPQASFATGSDERAAPHGLPLTNGDLRVPFKLSVPLSHKFTFVFQKKNIDETLGRVTTASGAFKYPGAYHGDSHDASVSYAAGSAVTWSAGYYQRHRACCPYDKIEEHLVYAGFEDDFGPVTGKKSLFVFSAQLLRSVNHKEDASFLAANAPGYTFGDYKGNLAIYRAYVEIRAPVAKKLRLLARAGIDSDYFDYQPVPLYYNYVNVGAQAALSPNVGYTMWIENLTQRNQGYPFAAPNAIHRAKILLQADFRVPF
jgi:hypothetical protein